MRYTTKPQPRVARNATAFVPVEKPSSPNDRRKKLVIFLCLIVFLIDISLLYWSWPTKTVKDTSVIHPRPTSLPSGNITKKPQASQPQVQPTASPPVIDPSQLATPTCSGRTILTVVAHQDDDLLFMSPDHIHAYRAGDCLRTVYLTAGDAGIRKSYWSAREKGSQNAYDILDGPSKDIWLENVVRLNDHQTVIVDNPKDNPRISLIFMRLPDGNVNGSGFPAYNYSSLRRLENGKSNKLYSVDGQSSYTSQELVDALAKLISFYHPDEIDAQAPVNMSEVHPDHSDHLLAGAYTRSALLQYATKNTAPIIKYYIGYPIDQSPENVSGQDYTDKADMFYSYAKYDGFVCQTVARCKGGPYDKWLRRQYEHAY